MKKTIFILTLSLSTLCANSIFAQEIPADIKTKIVEVAKSKKGWSAEKTEAWVERQVEAWESINSTKFSIPQKDTDFIKAEAQKNHPYHYTKQETFIIEQSEALIEIYELKKNFEKDEFEAIYKKLCEEKKNNYKLIAESLASIYDLKEEVKQFAIDGMDATTLAITKKVVAQQFPFDYKQQLKALKKQEKMLDTVQDAKNVVEAQKQKETNKTASKTEIMAKVEDTFKKSTLILSGNNKTATGIVTKINNQLALIFPAVLYSIDGISASSLSGEEAKISLKKCYSAKNAPLMLTFLEDLPFKVEPINFATNEELRDCIGNDVAVIGYFGEMIRPVNLKLSKIVDDEIRTQTPILHSYNEGTLVLSLKTFKPVAICLKPEKSVPQLNMTSNRLKNELERALNKEVRYMSGFRTDIPIKWVPVNPQNMKKQIKAAEQLKEINFALASLISGSLSEGTKSQMTASIATKYQKVLETRMDISKIKVEYRSFVSALTNLLRRPLSQIKTNDVYANLRNDLGLHLALAKMFETELKNEMRKNSFTLAPKEFKKNL